MQFAMTAHMVWEHKITFDQFLFHSIKKWYNLYYTDVLLPYLFVAIFFVVKFEIVVLKWTIFPDCIDYTYQTYLYKPSMLLIRNAIWRKILEIISIWCIYIYSGHIHTVNVYDEFYTSMNGLSQKVLEKGWKQLRVRNAMEYT